MLVLTLIALLLRGYAVVTFRVTLCSNVVHAIVCNMIVQFLCNRVFFALVLSALPDLCVDNNNLAAEWSVM